MRISDRVQALNEEREQRLRQAMWDKTGPTAPDVKIHRLSLALKKPGLSKMLGDANPLKDDEYELLQEFMKLKKERI